MAMDSQIGVVFMIMIFLLFINAWLMLQVYF